MRSLLFFMQRERSGPVTLRGSPVPVKPVLRGQPDRRGTNPRPLPKLNEAPNTNPNRGRGAPPRALPRRRGTRGVPRGGSHIVRSPTPRAPPARRPPGTPPPRRNTENSKRQENQTKKPLTEESATPSNDKDPAITTGSENQLKEEIETTADVGEITSEENGPSAPKKNRRQEILGEILATERGYVASLRFLVQSYIQPLADLNTQGNGILTPAEMSKLFSSISLIVNVNEELLNSLEERFAEEVSPSQCVGDVFLELAPYLKLYNQYSANYDDAIKALDQYKTEKDRFTSFLQAVAEKGGGQHADISFYLIMPIQRIPRYILLLSDLLKETPEDHPDKQKITNALTKIRDVASNVNNSIREAEGINKIVQIQSTLLGYDHLLIPTRRLLREAAVNRISSKGKLLPRSLYLFNDLILITKRKGAKQQLQMDIPIHLTWAKALPDAEKYEHVFQIASNKSSVVLTVSSEAERDDIVREISENRSHQISSSEKFTKERAAVESCLQPRLHAKLFQIDEYVEPLSYDPRRGPARAMKRTRNATTMIERLAGASELNADTISELFPLFELSDDSLQKFTEVTSTSDVSESKNVPVPVSPLDSQSDKRRDLVKLPTLHKSIRICGSDIIQPDFFGYLTKQGGVCLTWKKRWFVLKAKFLSYYKTRQDDNPAGIISLRGYSVIEASKASNKANSIRLVKPDGRTFYIYAATEPEILQWKSILEIATEPGNENLDHTCITALIFFLFWEGNSVINRDAAWRLQDYLLGNYSDGGLIQYLQHPSSFKPLKKLMSAQTGMVTPIQVALLRKLLLLALVEEVGKSLIASGFIECLYGHLEKDTEDQEATELHEVICMLISSLSHFDFFPCGNSLRIFFPWMKANGNNKILYQVATIFRNASPFAEFRQVVIEEKAMDKLYSCFSCGDETTLERLLQALLLLICDQDQCQYSSSLFQYACSLSLNPFTPLLPDASPKLQWLLIKIMNTLSAVDPSLLQSMDISCAPQLIEMFILDPDPVNSSLVFELTRFFNMMSRNHWIRGTLDNNESFIHCLINLISKSQQYALKEVTLRCLGNMCTSGAMVDKNKIVVHLTGVDVLLDQLFVNDVRVQEKALHCICYAVMNDKNKVSFGTKLFAEKICEFIKRKDCKSLRYYCFLALENANSSACCLLADRISECDLFGVILKNLTSMDDILREQCIRSVACIAISDRAKKRIVDIGGIDTICSLFSDKITIATPAIGAIGNLFMADSVKQEYMSDRILQSLLKLTDSPDPVLQKVVLQTLTSVALESTVWAEKIYSNAKYSIICEIETTGTDKLVRSQLAQFFSVLYSQVVRLETDKAGIHTQKAPVDVAYYRPRFLGYKIV